MQIMLTELQRKDVWDGWLGAETRANYLAEMCHNYHAMQKALTWITLASSSGAAAAVIATAPNWLRLALTLATAALSLWSLIANNNKNATDCSDLHFRWNKLALDYKALWNDMYDADAPKRLAELLQKDAEISKSCNALPNRVEALRKWQRYVFDQHGIATT